MAIPSPASCRDFAFPSSFSFCPNIHNKLPFSYHPNLLEPVPCSSKIRFSTAFCLKNSSAASPVLEEEYSAFLPTIELLSESTSSSSSSSPINLNALICGLFEAHPQNEEQQALAYDCYKKAKVLVDSFKPDQSTLKHVIRYLIQQKDWVSIISLVDDFKHYDVLPDPGTCARLISSCMNARKFRIVETMLLSFQSDKEVGLFSSVAVMRGYNKLHMFSSTIRVFNRMELTKMELNPECYCRVMEAYMRMGDYEKVIELFHEFEELKFGTTPFTGKIFGALCESLCKLGRPPEALDYIEKMRNSGISVDAWIYSCLISSFAALGDVNVTERLFEEAKNEGKSLRYPEMFLKMVLMYIELGLLEKTLEVVKEMKSSALKVSDFIFCTIINGYAKKRGYRSAGVILEELLKQGCEPGQVTYASIINIYCRLGLYTKAEEAFLEMERRGYGKCVVAYSNIIAMYGKAGRLSDATRLVAKMKAKGCKPNVWIYNTLMEMHGRAKNLRQVEKLWKEMKRRKVAPDKISYTSLIGAYNKAKEYEKCITYYHEFRDNNGVPDGAMAGIMVAVFSKSGWVDELIKLLQDLKMEGINLDRRLYWSAFNALSDAGLHYQAEWLQANFEGT